MIFSIPPLIALAAYASAAPTGSTTASAAASSPTVAYASDDPNNSFLSEYANSTPQPIRGSTGASILGPQNVALERQGPDFLAPPTTDSGSVCVSLRLAESRLCSSFLLLQRERKVADGTLSQQASDWRLGATTERHVLQLAWIHLRLTLFLDDLERDMPIATAMAGVDMRLEAGAIR